MEEQTPSAGLNNWILTYTNHFMFKLLIKEIYEKNLNYSLKFRQLHRITLNSHTTKASPL